MADPEMMSVFAAGLLESGSLMELAGAPGIGTHCIH
jgi:hypothetical protein